jgi:hypothetical protein
MALQPLVVHPMIRGGSASARTASTALRPSVSIAFRGVRGQPAAAAFHRRPKRFRRSARRRAEHPGPPAQAPRASRSRHIPVPWSGLAREATSLAARTDYIDLHAHALADLAEVLRLAGRPDPLHHVQHRSSSARLAGVIRIADCEKGRFKALLKRVAPRHAHDPKLLADQPVFSATFFHTHESARVSLSAGTATAGERWLALLWRRSAAGLVRRTGAYGGMLSLSAPPMRLPGERDTAKLEQRAQRRYADLRRRPTRE